MTVGTGYTRPDGRWANVEKISLLAGVLAAGQNIGAAVDVGDRGTVRLGLTVSANSGTSPTLDVTVQTSGDGSTAWRTLGTFSQKTGVAFAMTAVTATGTSPPTLTLTGTPTSIVDLRVEVTTGGTLTNAIIRYSLDGGGTWTSGVTSAATIALGASGLTLNMAAGTFNVDNVYVAKNAGSERRSFTGLARYVRAVATVGGTSTPTVTATLSGELV